MRRRGFLAAALVSLLEIKQVRAKDKECVHDFHCLDGRVCVDGQCVGAIPCTTNADCTPPAICLPRLEQSAICVTITVDGNGITLVQPVTVNLVRRRKRRRKGRRRRH